MGLPDIGHVELKAQLARLEIGARGIQKSHALFGVILHEIAQGCLVQLADQRGQYEVRTECDPCGSGDKQAEGPPCS